MSRVPDVSHPAGISQFNNSERGCNTLHSSEGYTDQHPDALRLTVVTGELDRSQFRVYANQVTTVAEIHIDAMIIGASHIVTLDTGYFKLHEVFACCGPRNVPSWCLEHVLYSPVEFRLPGMRYEFSAKRVHWQEPEPSELCQLLTASSCTQRTGIGLVQEFPSGTQAVTPKTVIVVTSGEASVVIETAHSYPNVRGLILSRSVLTHL